MENNCGSLQDIFRLAENIAQSIYSTEIYQSYLKNKNNVENNPNLKKKIDDYRIRQLNYSIKNPNGGQEDENAIIADMYAEIMLTPDAFMFLESEKEVVSILSKVFGVVTEKVMIDLDFMDRA